MVPEVILGQKKAIDNVKLLVLFAEKYKKFYPAFKKLEFCVLLYSLKNFDNTVQFHQIIVSPSNIHSSQRQDFGK